LFFKTSPGNSPINLFSGVRGGGAGSANALPNVFRFGENPGKISENLGKICENLRKIHENLGKLPGNTRKMATNVFRFEK